MNAAARPRTRCRHSPGRAARQRESRSRSRSCLAPIGDLGVEIPTVVVETRRVGYRADIIERVALEYLQADDDIRDLNAKVVNVVLHFNRHRHEIAERGPVYRQERRCVDARCEPPCSD